MTAIEDERQRRRAQVAQGYRIFAAQRWGSLGDGHITARDPELTDHMWLLRFDVGFESATADDVVLVGPDGTVVGSDAPINTTAYFIHHPVHAARPDVVGVAHVHTPWGTPFCALRRLIEPITQESCLFFDDHALFDDDEVQILGTSGGERIAAALGANRVALLANHGLLATGPSVPETIAAFVTLERVCEAHMKTLDRAKPISPEAARVAKDDLFADRPFAMAFDFLVRRHLG